MKDPRDAVEAARAVITHVEEHEWERRDRMALDSLSSYYRIQVDNNAELFTAELPDYVASYTAIEQQMNITSLPDELNVPAYVVRDLVGSFREWAFLYGYRNDEPDNEMIPIADYNDERTRAVLSLLNTRIDAGAITGQDAFLALAVAHQAYERSEPEESLEDVEEGLQLAQSVADAVAAIIETGKDSKGSIDWNKVGGSLDTVYNELHHEGLKNVARRKVARQIRDGEATPEDFLDGN